MSQTSSKLDYLKKYLNGSSSKENKKKKRKFKGSGMKIVDDDVDVSKMRQLDNDELEMFGGGEDAPVIVGIVDDRPEHVRVEEQFSKDKWKVITQDDGFNSSITVHSSKQKIKSSKMYKNSSDSDLSPNRKQSTDNLKHKERNKNSKNSSDSDLSPVRGKDKILGREKSKADSYKRKKDHSDSDTSMNNNSHSYRDDKHERKRPNKKQDSDSDLSPPRRNNINSRQDKNQAHKKHGSDWDLSPPPTESKSHNSQSYKKNDDSDLSPLRRNNFKEKRNKSESYKKHDSDSDLSPVRNKRTKRDSDSDMSPPRRKKDSGYNKRDETRQRKSRWDTEDDSRQKSHSRHEGGRHRDETVSKQMEKTLDGKKAGLQDANNLREETHQLKMKEEEMFKNMSDNLTGQHAKAVKRNLGKRETSEDREKQRLKEEKQKILDAKYDRWGKGIKQVEEHENRIKDYLHEAAKPLARYKDDKDLEDSLRNRERDGDPMLEYMRKKEKEKGGTSGEPERPVYKGPYPPNRFNLRPGHRWDGVDRSNGHEKNYFLANSKRAAMEAEKYKWSTEDM